MSLATIVKRDPQYPQVLQQLGTMPHWDLIDSMNAHAVHPTLKRRKHYVHLVGLEAFVVTKGSVIQSIAPLDTTAPLTTA